MIKLNNMKPILLWRSKQTKLKDGRKCSPYFVTYRLYGFRKIVKSVNACPYRAPKRILLTQNDWIIRKFFRLYLWLMRFGYSSSNVNRVYDSLWDIDTLGSSDDYTKYTFSHSCEMYSTFCIRLGKRAYLEYMNSEEKYLSFVRTYDNGISE